jgi:hypothetical protein
MQNVIEFPVPVVAGQSHELEPSQALTYIRGGRGRATLIGKETRYTFKFGQSSDKHDGPIFVKLLTGPNNDSDYVYIGYIPNGRWELVAGKKGNASHPAFRALAWYIAKAHQAPTVAKQATFLHEGSCGWCGRTLTVPESITRGIGPECAKKHGL